jgi:hypothetical protein
VLKTVRLKLSAHLRARIAREARQRGKTLDRWILEAVSRELERRERFLSYVKRAQRAGLETDPVAELDARQQVRYFLDRLSATHPGGKVTRLRPRSKISRLR